MNTRLGILILWTLVLFGLLLSPIGDVNKYFPEGFRHWDKIAHFGLFGITGFVSAFGAVYLRTLSARIVFGMAFALSLAVLTEGLQRFVARNAAFCDLLADVAGLSVGLLLYVLLELWRTHSSSPE